MEQSSFGIKKIVDCKIDQYGKQMYKVKWEPTWEPAENLLSCQHLIDQFWSFINKSKSNEEVASQYRKKMRIDTAYATNISKLSEDDKTEVHNLIARTNMTSAGNQIIPPRNNLQHAHGGYPNPPNLRDNFGCFDDKKGASLIKNEQKSATNSSQPFNTPGKSGKSSTGNAAALKYIENFENQYVKIILVCKMCNKEQSLKFSHNWKTHYLSHVSDKEKPHKCSYCPKAFVTAPQLKKHLKSHENIAKQEVVKQEFYPM